MLPLTLTIPKPILPVCNVPFLVLQLQHLQRHGINDVILCLQYLPDSVTAVVNAAAKKMGIRVEYALETVPLGTAGAIKNAEGFFDDAPLMVCNGDVLTDLNLTEMIRVHQERNAQLSIAVTPVADPSAYGLILSDADGRIQQFLEKPGREEISAHHLHEFFINAGTYIINRELFAEIPTGRPVSIERETFPFLLRQGYRLNAFKEKAYWLDMGTPRNYLQAHEDMLTGKVGEGALIARRGATKPSPFSETILCGENTQVMNPAGLKGFVSIGNDVQIGEETVIEDSVILDGTTIGKHVKITHSIVGRHCRILDFTTLEAGVLGDNTIDS